MTDEGEKLEGKFQSPELTVISVCHKCRACVHACPEKALKFGLSDFEVDREKCARRFFEEGECIDCAAGCHRGAVSLVWYEIKDGVIRRLGEDAGD
ncbi:MAG: hypothetical protein ACTSU5_01175 [Promethearchaeota archaeon]